MSTVSEVGRASIKSFKTLPCAAVNPSVVDVLVKVLFNVIASKNADISIVKVLASSLVNVATPVEAFNEPLVSLARFVSSRYKDKSISVSVPFSSVYVSTFAAIAILVTVSATFTCAPDCILSSLVLSDAVITPAKDVVAASIESFVPSLDCTATVEADSTIVILVDTLLTFAVFRSTSA